MFRLNLLFIKPLHAHTVYLTVPFSISFYMISGNPPLRKKGILPDDGEWSSKNVAENKKFYCYFGFINKKHSIIV